MLIRLSHSNPPVLTCIRDDGTMTYSKSRHGEYFARHDLMHYAVETTLGFREGFFGLIAAGRSIPSFSEPGTAATLPAQALHAELMVGQLDQEFAFSSPLDVEEFNAMLATSITQAGLPVLPALSAKDLSAIRSRYSALLAEYLAIPDSQWLELDFAWTPRLGASVET